MAGRQAWRPALQAGAALVWVGVIVLAQSGAAGPARWLAPVTDAVAALVQAMLRGVGVEAFRAGAYVFVPGAFAYEVALGCTGLAPAAVLAVAIGAGPGPARAKWWGFAIGATAVFAVNLVRLLHLFYLGLHDPRRFAWAHTWAWEPAIVLLTFATWAAWSHCARRGDGPGQGRRFASAESS